MKKIIDIAPFGSSITAEEKKTIREQSKTKPPTVKDVLMKTWAQDTEAMANDMIGSYYDTSRGTFFLPDGSVEYNFENAVDKLLAYLNSAAEVGK